MTAPVEEFVSFRDGSELGVKVEEIIADSVGVMAKLKAAELTSVPGEPGARNLAKKRIESSFKSVKNIILGLGTVLSETGTYGAPRLFEVVTEDILEAKKEFSVSAYHDRLIGEGLRCVEKLK